MEPDDSLSYLQGSLNEPHKSSLLPLTVYFNIILLSRLCPLCGPVRSGQNCMCVYIYIYFPLLPRVLHFRQCHLLWDNHPKTKFDASRFETLLKLRKEQSQAGLVLEIICRRTYSTNLLKTHSLCCNQFCGLMSTVLWDVDALLIWWTFCQFVFLIILLFRLFVCVCSH